MMVNDEGSISGGHSASKKLGGPEMYSVPSNELIAGFWLGKRTEKMREVKVEV